MDGVSFVTVALCIENSNRMARIAAIKQSLEKALHDESKTWAKYLGKVEKKTGVDRLYVFLSMDVRIVYFVSFLWQFLSCLINQLIITLRNENLVQISLGNNNLIVILNLILKVLKLRTFHSHLTILQRYRIDCKI